jgi:hypothetical protein
MKAVGTYGKKGNINIVNELINAGADVNKSCNVEKTALMKASDNKENIDIVKVLLEAGANVNKKDAAGKTAINDYAIMAGASDIVKLLIEAGADVNIKDKLGFTALRQAVMFKNAEIIKILLKAGADKNSKDVQGNTPMSFLKNIGRPDIEELFRSGAESNIINKLKDFNLNIKETFKDMIPELSVANLNSLGVSLSFVNFTGALDSLIEKLKILEENVDNFEIKKVNNDIIEKILIEELAFELNISDRIIWISLVENNYDNFKKKIDNISDANLNEDLSGFLPNQNKFEKIKTNVMDYNLEKTIEIFNQFKKNIRSVGNNEKENIRFRQILHQRLNKYSANNPEDTFEDFKKNVTGLNKKILSLLGVAPENVIFLDVFTNVLKAQQKIALKKHIRAFFKKIR